MEKTEKMKFLYFMKENPKANKAFIHFVYLTQVIFYPK